MKKSFFCYIITIVLILGNLAGGSGGFNVKSRPLSSSVNMDITASDNSDSVETSSLNSSEQSYSGIREKLDFNRGWKFARQNIPSAVEVDYPLEQLERWESVSLPHTVREEPFVSSGGINYQGEAMYRKHFLLDSSYDGKKLFIEFEGIMGVSDVWVNGNHLQMPIAAITGENSYYGGYLPIILDITSATHCDGLPNVITVLIDNSDDINVPPGKPQSELDFSYFGGIYRNAWLQVTEQIYISDANYENIVAGGGILVDYRDVTDAVASVDVKTHVRNASAYEKTIKLKTQLTGADGKSVGTTEKSVTIAAQSADTFNQTLAVQKPRLWSLDDPYLHTLSSSVLVDGNECDKVQTPLGIRKITMNPTSGILINDRPIGFLSGINRHQEYPYIGYAASASLQRRDAIMFKSAGFNVVRTAHHPQSVDFLNACDELGIMVIESIPGWQHWSSDPIFAARVKLDIQQMIRRDRNRPSILTFEISLNESTGVPKGFTNDCETIAKLEHPSVKTSAENHNDGAQGDILYGTPEEVAGWSETALAFIREYGDHWQEQNGLFNDFCRVTRDDGGFYPGGEAAMVKQGNNRLYKGYTFVGTGAVSLSEGIGHYNVGPRFAGMTMWIGVDHNRGGDENISACGIWDLMRLPKYSYYAFASQRPQKGSEGLAEKDVDTGGLIFIADSWGKTAPILDKKGEKIGTDSSRIINVYSNADRVKLSVISADNKVLWSAVQSPIKDKTAANLPHPPFIFENVPYTPLSHLKAEGLDAKEVAVGLTKEKHTAGQPAQLKIELDSRGQKVVADGADIVTAYAYVLDSEGNVCVDATNRLKFSVIGGAEIVGDGDMRVASNPINAEAGIAGIYLRAKETAGTVTLSVQSEGLAAASVSFTTLMSTIKSVEYIKHADGLPLDKVSMYLTDKEAFDPSIDKREHQIGTVNLGGVDYIKSLTVRNMNPLIYELDGAYSRFTAKAALADPENYADGATFKVYLDGTLRFSSSPISAQIENIDVDVSNAETMTIVAEDKNGLNSSAAVWLSPYLYEGKTPTNESELRQNLARGKAAKADSVDFDASVQAAVDGDEGSLWRSGQEVTSNNPQSYELDLGQVTAVRNARISVEHDYLKCYYDIYSSVNGREWDLKTSSSKTAHGNNILDKFVGSARYVKIVFTKVESSQGSGDGRKLQASIKELELFSDKGVDSVNEYNLKGLGIAGKDIVFSPNNYEYFFNYSGYEKDFKIKALAKDPLAIVSINGEALPKVVVSNLGDVPYFSAVPNEKNKIIITVKAASGAVKTYTITALGENRYDTFGSVDCFVAGVNGANNWVYQRQNKISGKFSDIQSDGGYIQGEYAWGYGADWLYSGARFMHPSNEDNAARAFIAPYGGNILFTASAQKYEGQPGSVTLSVLKNGTIIRVDCANMTLAGGKIDVSIAIMVEIGDQIQLVLDAYDGNGGDATCIMSSVKYKNEAYLSDLNWESAVAGDGKVMRDKSSGGSAITLTGDDGASVAYAKGIGTHAESQIVYDISGMDFKMFECYVGIDNSQNPNGINANVEFIVSVNDEDNVVYRSGVMRFDTPQKYVYLSLDSSVKKVFLNVTQGDNGNNWSDHSNWADAKFSQKPKLPTAAEVAGKLKLEPIAQKQTQMVLPTVPEGFHIALTHSGNPAVISLDGKITPQNTDAVVNLTYKVTYGNDSATITIKATVPKAEDETPSPPNNLKTGLKNYQIVTIVIGAVAAAAAITFAVIMILRSKNKGKKKVK